MTVHDLRHPWLRRLEDLSGALTCVIFPSGCRICEALLTRPGRLPVCEACLSSFPRVPEARCALCGQPWLSDEGLEEGSRFCLECCERQFAFDWARSFGLYESALARAILLLKFERIEPLGGWFAKRLAEIVREEADLFAVDIIVPVPLHQQRRKERGFNQVDLFGRPLARRLGRPYRPGLLLRSKPRPEKHLLRNEERWEAVRGAFAVSERGRVDNLRILLLDDVMTTGATLDACARALRDAGARSVSGLTIARALRSTGPAARTF